MYINVFFLTKTSRHLKKEKKLESIIIQKNFCFCCLNLKNDNNNKNNNKEIINYNLYISIKYTDRLIHGIECSGWLP